MKMPRVPFLVAALALGACTSPDRQAAEDVDLSTVICICGQPEAVIDGCANTLCVSREGNPDNPDCVCGPMSIRPESISPESIEEDL